MNEIKETLDSLFFPHFFPYFFILSLVIFAYYQVYLAVNRNRIVRPGIPIYVAILGLIMHPIHYCLLFIATGITLNLGFSLKLLGLFLVIPLLFQYHKAIFSSRISKCNGMAPAYKKRIYMLRQGGYLSLFPCYGGLVWVILAPSETRWAMLAIFTVFYILFVSLINCFFVILFTNGQLKLASEQPSALLE